MYEVARQALTEREPPPNTISAFPEINKHLRIRAKISRVSTQKAVFGSLPIKPIVDYFVLC